MLATVVAKEEEVADKSLLYSAAAVRVGAAQARSSDCGRGSSQKCAQPNLWNFPSPDRTMSLPAPNQGNFLASAMTKKVNSTLLCVCFTVPGIMCP